MKFVIESKEFKNITERVASIRPKMRTAIEDKLCIEADEKNQRVIISGANDNSFVEVFTDNVKVFEDGKGFVEVDILKRFYILSGEIIVEAAENTIKVYNSKKNSSGIIEKDDGAITYPEIVGNVAFTADKDDMVDTLQKLSCFLFNANDCDVKTGFNISVVFNKGRIMSCDGAKLGIREVDWNFSDDYSDLNITIPGYSAKELSKVSDNKRKGNIECFVTNKRVMFVGTDFTYTTRLLEGIYPDLDKIIKPMGSTYGFEVYSEDLFEIAKEYSTFLKIRKSVRSPMYFCHKDGKFLTVGISDKYSTSDMLTTKHHHDIPNDLRYAVNAALLKEIMSIFRKQIITVESNIEQNPRFSPWYFIGEKGYSALLMPIRASENEYNLVEDFIEDI